MSSSDLFRFIDNCYTKAHPVTPDVGQPDSAYMAARWLSLNPHLLLAVNAVNVISGRIPAWASGCALFHITPPGRPPRLKYPSKGKTSKTEEHRLIIAALMEYLNCGESAAEQTVPLLTAQGINLKTYFGSKLRK